MANPIILATELRKIYGEEIQTEVLKGITLQIEAQQFTALVGPSGSGKSTCLNLISLLDTITSGSLVIDGQDTTRMPPEQMAQFRNREMGFIFQFHYLLPEFTALENILMPCWIRKNSHDAADLAHAHTIMTRIGIAECAAKFPNQLSGGQQQRVSIARALINSPKIIFADEPTGNLDRETGQAVLTLMKEIINEKQATLIMVTHDRDIALQADTILELIDGRVSREIPVKAIGTARAREVFNH